MALISSRLLTLRTRMRRPTGDIMAPPMPSTMRAATNWLKQDERNQLLQQHVLLRERRPDRPGARQHRGAGRAGPNHLPAHSDLDHQQDQQDHLEGSFRSRRFCGHRQVRRLGLCDAASRLHDRLRQDRALPPTTCAGRKSRRPEHRRIHHGVRGAGTCDGRRSASVSRRSPGRGSAWPRTTRPSTPSAS